MTTETAQITVLLVALYALGFGVYWTKVFGSRQRRRFKAETGHDWGAQMSFFAFLVCVLWPTLFVFTLISALLPIGRKK